MMKMRNSKATIKTTLATAALLLCGLAGSAGAGIIPAGADYEVSYRMVLDSPTPTGNDVQSVFIFEWNDTQSSVASPYTIAGSGRTDLVHTIDFVPTSALVLGYLEAVPSVGDEKRHLYMLIDSAYSDFLNANRTGMKFSEIFGVGEQSTIDLLIDALAGDATALADITARVTDEFAPAAFDPAGGFKVMKWSVLEPPVGGNVPEPALLALLGIGLAGLGFRRRK